jgi:hypothetical protein
MSHSDVVSAEDTRAEAQSSSRSADFKPEAPSFRQTTALLPSIYIPELVLVFKKKIFSLFCNSDVFFFRNVFRQ